MSIFKLDYVLSLYNNNTDIQLYEIKIKNDLFLKIVISVEMVERLGTLNPEEVSAFK